MIDRMNMPQIKAANLPAFFAFARERGVAVWEGKMPGAAMKRKQAVAAESICALPPEVMAKPILVAADGFVLDGNHRAASAAFMGVEASVFQIGLPFEDAVALMFEFPEVYRSPARSKNLVH